MLTPNKKSSINPLQGFDPAKHELYAKSECNKCYGRGYVGKNLTTKEYQECTCLRMRLKPDIDPNTAQLIEESIHDNMLSLYPPLVNRIEPVQSAPESIVVVDEIQD